MSEYVFGAADLVEQQRLAMQRCLDDITRQRLSDVGVGPGWRCLDVGAGGGSVAAWLADRVGPTGHVLATDLDPAGLRSGERLAVRQHDIVEDELPERTFDLVHARLVLLHLPKRRKALARMVRALRPGGHLLLGEFDCTWMPTLASRDPSDSQLFDRFHGGLCTLLEQSGADIRWGVHAYAAMADEGLVDIDWRTSAEAWRGGGPGCRWLQVNARQLRTRLIECDLLTGPDVDRLDDLLQDPELVVSSYLTVMISGRRPMEGASSDSSTETAVEEPTNAGARPVVERAAASPPTHPRMRV